MILSKFNNRELPKVLQREYWLAQDRPGVYDCMWTPLSTSEYGLSGHSPPERLCMAVSSAAVLHGGTPPHLYSRSQRRCHSPGICVPPQRPKCFHFSHREEERVRQAQREAQRFPLWMCRFMRGHEQRASKGRRCKTIKSFFFSVMSSMQLHYEINLLIEM